MKPVLFVHGTGVREPVYSSSFKVIEHKLKEVAPDAKLFRCFWGEHHGARLLAGGLSIPNYQQRGTASRDVIAERVLWSQLYRDPLMELRVLPHRSAHPSGPLLPTQTLGKQQLMNDVQTFQPSAVLIGILEQYYVHDFWEEAINTVRNSPECMAVFNTRSDDYLPHRSAIARAIVAQLLQLADEYRGLVLTGPIRDEILDHVRDELHGYGLGRVDGWIKDQVVGLGQWAQKKFISNRRGHYTDTVVPMAGDVLLYQTRGHDIRKFIHDRIRKFSEKVIILAHSLGGIACADLLVMRDLPQVACLITVGSQIPFLYELNLLSSLRYDEPLPEHFPQWVNIYDLNDYLSFKGEALFGQRIQDYEVDNGQLFLQAHSAYWFNPQVWQTIGKVLE